MRWIDQIDPGWLKPGVDAGAFLLHPLIGDYDKAKAALDELLETDRPYLPQFIGSRDARSTSTHFD